MACNTCGVNSDDRRERLIRAGRWLRDQRIRRGFATQVELARLLGVDKAAISNYENGKNAVDDDKAELIAEGLGIDIITVRRNLGLWVPTPKGAGVMDEAERDQDENERLIAEILALPPRDQQAVKAVIDALKETAETSGPANKTRR